MSRVRTLVAAIAVMPLALFSACLVEGPAEESENVGELGLELGCHWDCPKCVPNKPCIKMACFEVCHGATPCGDTKCGDGKVCCNESCGICTDPWEGCTQQYCMPAPHGRSCDIAAKCMAGYHWSSTACNCLKDAPGQAVACTSDADCRTFSDYCTGCSCLALGANDPAPVCDGPGVECFADPCMNIGVVCLDGTCSLQ